MSRSRHPQDALARLRELAVHRGGGPVVAQPEGPEFLATTNTGRHAPGFHGARMGGPAMLDEMVAAIERLPPPPAPEAPRVLCVHPSDVVRFDEWFRLEVTLGRPAGTGIDTIAIVSTEHMQPGRALVLDRESRPLRTLVLPWAEDRR
jgi:hypothetical protein